MAKETVQFKRTVRGSVGAGMGALFNGSGRQFYVLEHKNASKYHHAGESQKIIIDQIVLGRDSNCQVRFDDESWPSVSRRHAAIEKDAQGWKIIPLSQTNSTLVNGRSIDKEWYLQNGDEIQLATNGPRLGFIVPAGKQSLVSSIKLTERLNLFRAQALRPYKRAIAALCAVLVVACSVGGYIIYNQQVDITNLLADSEKAIELIDGIKKKAEEDSIRWEEERRRMVDELNQNKKEIVRIKAETAIENHLAHVESSVYAIITSVYAENSNEKILLSRSQGTGFLLIDGRFITARHCVEPWMFTPPSQDVHAPGLQEFFALSNEGLFKMYSEIVAINNQGEQLTFTSEEFKIDRTYDSPISVPYIIDGNNYTLKGAVAFGTTASLGNDWAYVRVPDRKGKIEDGKAVSDNLKKGKNVHLLGFPKSLGIMDGEKLVEPIYNKLTVSRNDLNEGRCIMVNQGVDHGNSGGPVFALDNGKFLVIGIVSRGDSQSEYYNHLIPMSNLK